MALSRQIAETIAKHGISAADVVETLRSYNLLALLPLIKNDLEKLSKDQGERDKLHVESPHPLGKEALAKIRRIVGNDLAETSVTLSQELLAGFRARWKGRLFDGSAQRIIRQLLSK